MAKRGGKQQSSEAFRPVNNPARQYENRAGERISRRQYMNIRAKEAGFSSWSEYQKLAKDPQYQHFIKEAIASQGRTYRGMRAMDSEFHSLYLKARKPLDTKKGAAYKSPKGAAAKFLTYVGLRDPAAKYDVGDTP